MYRCPVCAAPLAADERSYRCGNGHSFDLAREGYVNLVSGRGARARASGDAPSMVRARRLVLDAGYFDRLRGAVIERVAGGPVLDVGCGEGFYSRPLDGSPGWVGAIDLSKTAVRLAARRASNIHYAVANAFRMPVQDGVIGTLLSVFGPLAGAEYRRVLRSDGSAILVTPGPSHLLQLKELVFDEPTGHSERGPRSLDEHLRFEDSERLTYDAHFEQPWLRALLEMTPYAWHLKRWQDERLAAATEVTVTLDFLIVTLRSK